MNRRFLNMGLIGGTLVLGAAVIVGGWGVQPPATEYNARGENLPVNALWLDSLDVTKIEQDWGKPGAGKTVDGNPLRIGGVAYPHGIGTHADSDFRIQLNGAATRFVAEVGVDDEAGPGTVIFQVFADDKMVFDSGVRKVKDPPVPVNVDLRGVKRLQLQVLDAGDGINFDHADWGGAAIFVESGREREIQATEAPTVVGQPTLPIWMAPDSPKPAIHGPRITGSTPGKPFLFRIPTTGTRPLTFSAKNLPAGVTLDSVNGVLSGSLKTEGTTVVEMSASNSLGTAKRKLVIVGGKGKLALTPPLGWNSWNVWGTSVDAEKVKAAADSFVSTGLADHGFTYVNIDDGWEGTRDSAGALPTNEKFGDMKGLADYIHARGLKLGIYSSPGPQTCAGYAGTFLHDRIDADTWAEWGVDYLKYDWCSYSGISRGDTRAELMYPYLKMKKALEGARRDILFSLCQYGMGQVWEWGETVGGDCWRTTGDITDTWKSLESIGFSQAGKENYAGPSRWNDPDMLIVGWVGWGPNLHQTRLTPNEQITHITLWSLLASPLLIGCDLTRLDDFTRAILTNDEVLDVNQDPLGTQARRVVQDGKAEVWARPLFDGTQAVGLFNRGVEPRSVTVRWSDLKMGGRQPVRDLWQRKKMGTFGGSYTVTVPGHGAILIKVGKPERTDFIP